MFLPSGWRGSKCQYDVAQLRCRPPQQSFNVNLVIYKFHLEVVVAYCGLPQSRTYLPGIPSGSASQFRLLVIFSWPKRRPSPSCPLAMCRLRNLYVWFARPRPTALRWTCEVRPHHLLSDAERLFSQPWLENESTPACS